MRGVEGGGSPKVVGGMQVDYYSSGSAASVLRSTRLASALPARSSYNDRHTHHHHGQRRSGVQESLYRSNSSLELMQDHGHQHEPKPATPVLRREYGSHGSIDVIASERNSLHNGDSFFDMLQEYKPLGGEQRSGAEFVKNKSEDTLVSSLEEERTTASPKLRLKFHKFWGAGGKPGRTLDDSILSSVSAGSGTNSGEEERQRRRAFAHYDCQSVTANLSYAAKLRSLLLSRRRNTTTGASAASMLRSTTPDGGDSGDEDQGDGRNNDLLESCPFFRNEIGGEEERVVGLVRNQGSRRANPLHRPALSCGLSVLEFSNGETHWTQPTCPYYAGPRPIEAVDQGALYYRQHFYGQEHQNWFGMDENLGPVAMSLRRERVEKSSSQSENNASPPHMFRYRVVIRTSELLTLRGSVLEDAIPNIKPTTSSKSMNSKEVLEYVAPEIQLSCLRLGVLGTQTEEALLKLDEQGISRHYKVGIMYCKAGQSTEEQMYNNQDAGPAFTEFLDTIGQKVRLKGFDKYKAGLDNKTDSTGLYSIYAEYQECEIMFHVSTLLPFTPNNRQQLLRKRHIGNDIVTIVFQEPGAQPFTPKVIRSQFQHVFIVIRAVNPCTENAHYLVAVTRSKEVPVFGPPIPEGASFPKSEVFADFLLAKVINAENAAHRSDKFATMATRTRQEYLKDLVSNYTTSTVVETNQKFSMLSFSSKKKERWRPRFLPDATQRGAICWQVLLDDSSQSTFVDCFLAISSDSIVLIEEASREIVFVTPCKSVLGWTTNTNSLRLYYHQGECITIHMREGGERDELMEVVVRLRSVTGGSVAQELSLKRNPLGQLGFHVQPDGVVTQVESMGLAWMAGLRQGARLVEICKVAVSTLTHDQMVDLLKTSMAVTVTVIPPLGDGSIRRGCTLQNCKYNTNYEGDYENVNNSDNKLNKTARQQAVACNIRKRYERSFSPPRSSNSSGYGTGSSSKSFTGAERFANIEGTMTSSSSGLSSDERWYEILENGIEQEGDVDSPPPPLPARLNSYLQMAANKGSGFSLLDPTQSEFKVGEKVTACLLKAERSHELRRHIERNHHDYHLNQAVEFNGTSHYHGPPTNEKANSLPLDCTNGVGVRTVQASDGHSTDTSSTSDRLFGLPSEDDLSGSSSPRLRRCKTTGSMTPGGNGGARVESPRQRDTGEARLRPGVTPRSQRNSANLHQSTLQQDLMKLINPDYIPDGDMNMSHKEGTGVTGRTSNSGSSVSLPEIGKSRSRENLANLSLSHRPHSPPTKEKTPQEIILTLARPATVISNASTASSPAPSENKLSKEERLSPRVTKTIVNKHKVLPLTDSQEMDWPSLVDSATRGMLHVDTSDTNLINQTNTSQWDNITQRISLDDNANSQLREQELNKHISQLEGRLSRETMRRLSLEEEVRNLREENRRLQQESQSAAQQLRRFTEWFFQTIDKQ